MYHSVCFRYKIVNPFSCLPITHFQLPFLPLGKPTQPRGRPEASTRSRARSRVADLQCAALAPCERVAATRFPNGGSGSIAARLIGGGCLLDGAALYSMVCILYSSSSSLIFLVLNPSLFPSHSAEQLVLI